MQSYRVDRRTPQDQKIKYLYKLIAEDIPEAKKQYMQQGITEEDLKKNHRQYNGLVYFIGLKVFKPLKELLEEDTQEHALDLELLEILKDCYITLCKTYNQKPSAFHFSEFIGISPSIFEMWKKRERSGTQRVEFVQNLDNLEKRAIKDDMSEKSTFCMGQVVIYNNEIINPEIAANSDNMHLSADAIAHQIVSESIHNSQKAIEEKPEETDFKLCENDTQFTSLVNSVLPEDF